MRLLRGVYEGPGSHGILRVAASMRGVRAVLRALPGEGYFSTLHGAWTRSGEAAPVSVSPVWEKPAGSREPGDVSRDLSGEIRRHPATEAIVLARSEAALLSGEPTPVVALPENETGRSPKLVTCEWESVGMGEAEAADLALEGMVRAHARQADRSTSPTVNIFGPPLFDPNAEAEYEEAERLLSLLGIGVNTRAPLGATVSDLRRLPRAWANLLIYRETGDAATLYLQDEFGTPRVTTPMIGAAGTGAVLRSMGELCGLDAQQVRQTTWNELGTTAKLPWYARLHPPETFRGVRVAIFGDFTRTLGLGYALSREIGLEVGACGTYLTHLERDFLFHASTFTDEAFVADDPDQAASSIEDSRPDLLIGTHLESEVADSLGIPFLQLCPPVINHPFVERPLMGYRGSSVLADALEEALRHSERGQREQPSTGLPWTDEALEGLEKTPEFLRGRTRQLAEQRAREAGSREVTREALDDTRN